MREKSFQLWIKIKINLSFTFCTDEYLDDPKKIVLVIDIVHLFQMFHSDHLT